MQYKSNTIAIWEGGKKIARTYRLPQDIIEELKEIANTLGISETEAVSKAIHILYLQLKGEEKNSFGGSIVPFSEYQKVQEQLKQALYKLGELQGRLEEKENLLKTKEDFIMELRKQIEELKTKPQRKWWEFWK